MPFRGPAYVSLVSPPASRVSMKASEIFSSALPHTVDASRCPCDPLLLQDANSWSRVSTSTSPTQISPDTCISALVLSAIHPGGFFSLFRQIKPGWHPQNLGCLLRSAEEYSIMKPCVFLGELNPFLFHFAIPSILSLLSTCLRFYPNASCTLRVAS